jgi:hypothetical protein
MTAGSLAAVMAAPAARERGRTVGNLWRLALADFLERTRRPAYVVSLLVMAWLANGMLPPASAPYRTFVMEDRFRPAYGPEWVGTLVGILTALYFLLVGFYQVKGSVERDRRTGVGQILAAARVSRRRYLAGKVLSNFLVLASMAVLALGVALVSQQLLGEDRRFDLLAAAVPLLAITLPVAAIVASFAVLLECIPGLAGGAGNIVWFVVSMVALGSGVIDSETSRGSWRDLLGVGAVAKSTYATLHAIHPKVPLTSKGMSMGVNVSERWKKIRLETFRWPGLEWGAEAVAKRAIWFAIAAAFVGLAAMVFDRFDRPARARSERAGPLERLLRRFSPQPRSKAAGAARASALTVAPRALDLPTLVRAEFALLARGQSAWWYLGALAFAIAGLAAPEGALRAGWLPVAFIWPILALSPLGGRERLHGTEALLFSAPRPVTRLLAASWLAGFLLVLALCGTAVLHLALLGRTEAALGALLGCALLPALALALGAWTGSGKFFEVLVLFVWYVGPMHHVAEMDYTGVTTPRPVPLWIAYVAITAGLLAAAWLGRSRQVQR